MSLRLILALPLITAALTIGLVIRLGRTWQQQAAIKSRLWRGVMIAASLGFLFFLHTWNLLGYRF